MKLSAPPPPPPPPDGPNPGANAPGPDDPNQNPEAGAPGGQTPGTENPPPPEASAGPPARPLRWPSWAPGVDATLAGLALLLAFASASFVARNSDVWLHLAAGKRLLHGEYTPGTDPFSYTGADRPWVNHSWLADAGAYLLYGGEGQVLVATKALAVVLAFALLLAIRRPQYPLWPWAALACVAVLAAAPYLSLRPHVLSVLFLALTLFIVFRLPRGANPWRVPIAIGVTFWLWANCDAWFILGPLALALLLVGEVIQKYVLAIEVPEAEAEAEPLGRMPDVATLAKALAVGVVACMLNPHHVRVWQLPFELVGAPGAETDLRLRALLISVSDETFYNNSGFGRNANGLAFAVLVAAGAAAMGFGTGRLRASHVALWVGFLLLAIYRVSAIPFFAVVAVPLIAAQLNSLSETRRGRAGMILVLVLVFGGILIGLLIWLALRRRGAFETSGAAGGEAAPDRFELALTSIGRVLCVLGACALCVLAYPGWLQPEAANSAYARRVAWGVEADPLLARAAGQLEQWRERGELPPGDRGVIDSTELANYVAWFAPREKVFLNSNLAHHRPELPEYLRLRRALGLTAAKDEARDPKDLSAVMAQAGAAYLAVSNSAADPPFLRARSAESRLELYRWWKEWTPWYLDGQTTVFGFRQEGEPGGPAFAALTVDPVALAFAPGAAPLPDPELRLPPEPGWEQAFLRPPQPAPPGAAEALGWMHYRMGPATRLAYRQFLRDVSVRPLLMTQRTITEAAWLLGALRAADARGLLRLPPAHPDAAADAGALRAAPLLALRAARQAILKDPDHPEPYFALAEVLRDPDLPLSEGERALGAAAAYQQCLARIPRPDRYRRGQFSAPATLVARRLAEVYLGGKGSRRIPVRRRPDGSAEEREVSTGYIGMSAEVPGLRELLGDMVVIRMDASGRPSAVRVPLDQFNAGDRSQLVVAGPTILPLDVAHDTLELALQYAQIDFAEGGEEEKQSLEQVKKEVQDALVQSHKVYDAMRGPGAKVPALVDLARRKSLLGESLRLLSDKDLDVAKEFGARSGYAAMLQVALELALGKVENADFHLSGPGGLATPEKAAAVEQAGLTRFVRLLQHQKAILAGQYREAGELLEAMEKNSPPLSALLAEFANNKIDPRELLLAEFARYPTPGTGATLLPRTAFQMAVMERGARAIEAREIIVTKLQQEARFFYRRGALSLLEGDIPGARQRFQQSTRKPPPGWALSDIYSAEAGTYLRLIEAAEKKSAAP